MVADQRDAYLPRVDIASNCTTLDTLVPGSTAVRYYRTGSYTLANLRVDFDVMPNITLGVGARNLFDDYYMLTDGFPEQGRSLYASIRANIKYPAWLGHFGALPPV